MLNSKLSQIRELVDELYDNTEPHTSEISSLFLEINQAIDEAQKLVTKSQSADPFFNATEQNNYYLGTDLDAFNEKQVNDIIEKMKRGERVY